MRATAAMLGVVVVTSLGVTARAFLLSPAAAPAPRSTVRRASPSIEANASPRTYRLAGLTGLWCIGGAAAVAAASAKGRRTATKVRGSVAVKVVKAADQVAQRLKEAFQVSKDIKIALEALERQNTALMEKLDTANTTVASIQAERDKVKRELTEVLQLMDTLLMGSLNHTAEMATDLSELEATALRASAAITGRNLGQPAPPPSAAHAGAPAEAAPAPAPAEEAPAEEAPPALSPAQAAIARNRRKKFSIL